MTTRRSFDFAGVVGGLTLLAGLLAPGTRPLMAQDTGAAPADSTPLELVFVVFPEPAGAGHALAAMDSTQRQGLESYAVVTKDKEGNVKVEEKEGKNIDGVVALLGRPPQDSQAPTQNQTDTSGYAPGTSAANTSGISEADASQMSGMLGPGGSALILVVEDPNAPALESSMQKAKGTPEVMVVDVIPVE
jgi:hypothetical protein